MAASTFMLSALLLAMPALTGNVSVLSSNPEAPAEAPAANTDANTATNANTAAANTAAAREAAVAGAVAPATVAVRCAADLDSVERVVRVDYPGFAPRSSGRGAALEALTDSVRALASQAQGEPACTRAIQRWLGFFDDPHLSLAVTPSAAPTPAPSAPRPAAPRGPREDPPRPAIRFPDDSSAVLRLPSFELEHAAAIDSLVAGNRSRLASLPYLVVDVRRNGGGWSGSYAALLPLLYTGPIRVEGWDVWSSPGNVAEMRVGLDYPGLPAEIAEQIAAALPRMEATPGTFVTLEEDRVVRLDTVLPLPRAVAVLVDRRCASSCEQFVLAARQSAKVVVIGAERTRGALEYGNVRAVRLPSALRELSLPIARSHWGAASPEELDGIEPDVALPQGEADAVGFALRHLASGARP